MIIYIHIDNDTIKFAYLRHVFFIFVFACKDTNYSPILQIFRGKNIKTYLEPGGDNLCRRRRAYLPVAEKFFAVGGNRLSLIWKKSGGHLLWCPPECYWKIQILFYTSREFWEFKICFLSSFNLYCILVAFRTNYNTCSVDVEFATPPVSNNMNIHAEVAIIGEFR